MKLSNFFKPAWKHSNREVRLKAIESIQSEATTLIEILENDEDQDVRAAAFKCLGRCAADVRKIAVSTLRRQSVLADFADQDPEVDIRLAAVRKLEDIRALMRLAREASCTEVRVEATRALGAAVERLSERWLLEEVARTARDSNVRIAAIRQIWLFYGRDSWGQRLLAEIAKSADDQHVRIAAVRQLRDQRTLADIARTDDDPGVRVAAVEGMASDDPSLRELVQSADHQEVRVAAVKRIQDPDSLGVLARNTSDPEVRGTAEALVARAQLALRDAVEKLKTERDFRVRVDLARAVVANVSHDTLNLLGEAMSIESGLLKDYGEPVREMLVKAYSRMVGLSFPKTCWWTNQYGAKVSDEGLVAALAHWRDSRKAVPAAIELAGQRGKIEGVRHPRPEIPTADWQEYRTEAWGFALRYPKDWEIVAQERSAGRGWTSPVTIGSSEGVGGPADMIVSVRNEEILQGRQNVKVTSWFEDGTSREEPSTPAEFLASSRQELCQRDSSATLLNERETEVGGHPAAELAYCEGPDGAVTTLVVTIFAKGLSFQLKCQAPKVEFANFEPIFRKMMETFVTL